MVSTPKDPVWRVPLWGASMCVPLTTTKLQLRRVFSSWRNWRSEKERTSELSHKRSGFTKYIASNSVSETRGRFLWMKTLKTHYWDPCCLSHLCDSATETREKILSSCWNHPFSVQVGSSQRSCLYLSRTSCLQRRCLPTLSTRRLKSMTWVEACSGDLSG